MHTLWPLFRFSYDAAKDTTLSYRIDEYSDSLSVQGLDIGFIKEVSSVLECQNMHAQASPSDMVALEADLPAIWRLVSRDCRHVPVTDFASYLIGRLRNRTEHVWIPLSTIWCDQCEQQIGGTNDEGSSTPIRFYHCGLCSGGDFDICTSCYDDQGRRCKSPDHVLRELDVTSISLPSSDKFLELLHSCAADGQCEIVSDIVSHGYDLVRFFTTSTGLRGTASENMHPGDIVVILFGSRVPFVLRKCDSVYRLVSSCYVLGFMNGEAIDMWKNGELDGGEFEIR